MIDIHCHLLSGIDDGAESLHDSVKLSSVAFDNRVTTVVATPHLLRCDEVISLSALRDKKIAELKAILEKEKIQIEIASGFEVYCTESVLRVSDFSELTINGGRYILTEFDFVNESIYGVLRITDYLISKGLVPIIAHPERYAFFLDDYDSLNSLARKNVLFQLNVGSLIGHYGHREMRLARAMLECGFCDFLATDAHSLHSRSTNLLEMICQAGDVFSAGELKKLTQLNPLAVINNCDIEKPQRGYISSDLL